MKNPSLTFRDVLVNALKKDPSGKLAFSLIQSKCDGAHLDSLAACQMLEHHVKDWEYLAPMLSKNTWKLLGEWYCSIIKDMIEYPKKKHNV